MDSRETAVTHYDHLVSCTTRGGHFRNQIVERTADLFATRIGHQTETAIFAAAFHDGDERGYTVGARLRQPIEFFDFCTDDLKVEGITVSPGYAYERAPDQEHFLNRTRTKQLFRDIFRAGSLKRWRFSQSTLFMDFLAGNQQYQCTPWGNPTRNIFG